MKAYVLRSYGPPETLVVTEVDRPVPGAGEVLVRVRATSVNPYDWHHLRGEPYVARLMAGTVALRRPKLAILGCDVAGEVAEVGPGVTGFEPGDGVFALLERCGGYAEYVAAPADLLAPKPANLSYEQAAAVPMAAVTALVAVTENARVQAGQRVLVNGASGGVGTFAVQLARRAGAEVTGVCGPRNVDLVRSLGAEVIDYSKADFTAGGGPYDVLLDIAGSRPLRACRRVLARDATVVAIGGPAGRWIEPAGHVLATLARGRFASQRVVVTSVENRASLRQDLVTLAGYLEDGTVTPVIGREYAFDDLPAAVAYQEQGHATGKVVVSVTGG